jgi:hypothetical protein
MQRFVAAVAAALIVLGLASASRAEGAAIAVGPVLGGESSITALKLLDGWRETVEVSRRRVKLPRGSVQAEAEAPGEALTKQVERVWSQARVYKRPGGAELILRGKF